jgi:hypothetical protein
MAVIDKSFVLDVIDDGDGRPLVLAGRQLPKGLQIDAALARVVGGHLLWLNDRAKLDAARAAAQQG